MMQPTHEPIDSLTVHVALDSETLAHVLDVLSSCEEAVTACAAGMLAAQDLDQMRSFVLRDMDCGDVVATTRRLLTRAATDDNTLITAQLETCLIACQRSEEHCKLTAAEHEHCRLCMAATHQAVEACRQALKILRGVTVPSHAGETQPPDPLTPQVSGETDPPRGTDSWDKP